MIVKLDPVLIRSQCHDSIDSTLFSLQSDDSSLHLYWNPWIWQFYGHEHCGINMSVSKIYHAFPVGFVPMSPKQRDRDLNRSTMGLSGAINKQLPN